jgi:hypothetical protein
MEDHFTHVGRAVRSAILPANHAEPPRRQEFFVLVHGCLGVQIVSASKW